MSQFGNIDSKGKFFRLYQEGVFGNKIRTWESFEDVQASGYADPVTIRYRGHGGGGFCRYDVPVDKVEEAISELVAEGADRSSLVFNEWVTEDRITLQGELARFVDGLYMFYSLESVKMREAMSRGKEARNTKAKLLLETLLTGSSYADMEALLEMFPDHVIEFTAFDKCIGSIPGRNAVIWEVRNY